jgi:hypothetical protein
MKAGDRVRDVYSGRMGIADEFLSDGDCYIVWNDKKFGITKWNNLEKINDKR